MDTHILIWGIKGICTPGQEEMLVHARDLLRALSDSKERVMLPSPVVCEYMIGLPKDSPHRVDLFARGFFTYAFDVPCAEIAAELQSDRDRIREIRGTPPIQIQAQALKIDAMIVAIAIRNNARQIISNDAHVKELAGQRIPVISLSEFRPLLTERSFIERFGQRPRRIGP